MNFKAIKTMFSAIWWCAIVASVFALAGCSEKENGRYEMPSCESNEEYSTNSEMPSADSPSETISEDQTNSDEHQSYKEFRLDQQLLKTVEQEKLYVKLDLRMDDEAIRNEYENKYPNLLEDNYHWFSFLCKSGDKIIRELVSDYNIAYDDLTDVLDFTACFCCELDKDTVSSLLDDPRVYEIVYFIGEHPIAQDC